MKPVNEAMDALFGAEPVTELPQSLIEWTPPPGLVETLLAMGITSVESLTTSAAHLFASDPSYFEELTQSALNSRAVRARAATRKGNRNG